MAKINKLVELELSPKELATAFCLMGDENQAQFFIEASEIAKTWDGSAEYQWSVIGGHLKTCKCSTREARSMVRAIAHYTYEEEVPQ